MKRIYQKFAMGMIVIVLINHLQVNGSIVYASEKTDTTFDVEFSEEMEKQEMESSESEMTDEEINEEIEENEETKDSEVENTEESDEPLTEEVTEEETTEEETTEEETIEEETTEEIEGYVTFWLDAQEGSCEIDEMVVALKEMEYDLPEAVREGYQFMGWFMDPECEHEFCEEDILWEDGYEYTLFAGYEEIKREFSVQRLEKSVNGIKILVEGNFPEGIELQVKAVTLEQDIRNKLTKVSDIIDSVGDINKNENKTYSYDITLLYEEGEYEPYEFDEMVKVTFQFDNQNELRGKDELEVIHVQDDSKELEQVDITFVSDSVLSFEADHFSTYIIIADIAYTGEKEWKYDFNGDMQVFEVPLDGVYVMNLYGAQGANGGSRGTYANAQLELEAGDFLYIYVGGQNGYNGGGESNYASGSGAWARGYNGGGATDIRLNGTALTDRIMVAGGGSGASQARKTGRDYRHYRDEYGYNRCDYTQVEQTYNGNASGNSQTNGVLGAGSQAQTSVYTDNWRHSHGGDYPYEDGQEISGTIYTGRATGGGGGGYYGGTAGYAGTSFIDQSYQHNSTSVINTDSRSGNGMVTIQLLAGRVSGAQYNNYDGSNLEFCMADSNGHTSQYQKATPQRASDEKFQYQFKGWDVVGTAAIECYSHEEAAQLTYSDYTILLATYQEIGQRYELAFDEDMASVSGTTQLEVQYNEKMSDITIPQKSGYIFDGYYSEPNGNGTKVYQCDGISVRNSYFTEDTTLFANWVDPLTIVEKTDEKTLVSGYTGVVLQQEANLSIITGYGLSYRWLVNVNNTPLGADSIEETTTNKCILPNLGVGQYYVFCEVTATNFLNGQEITKTATVTRLIIEKGTIASHNIQVKNDRLIYDGEVHALEAELSVDGGCQIYYAEKELTRDNYLSEGSLIPYTYSEAGEYTNYIYVVLDNYDDFKTSITMEIEKATPRIYLASKNVTYLPNQTQGINQALVYGVEDQLLTQSKIDYLYFTDEQCTNMTSAQNGAVHSGKEPEMVGTYYVLATVAESENYKQAITVIPAMFNILGTRVGYSVTGYEGIYDGKEHGLTVTCEDADRTTFYFSDETVLTEDNYLQNGSTIPYLYIKEGKYQIYYLAVTKLTDSLNTYEAGSAYVIIHKASSAPGNQGGNNSTNDGNGNESDSTGNNSGNSQVGKPGNSQQHVHTFGDYEYFLPPTFQTAGYAIYPCLTCDYKQRVDFERFVCANHNFVIIEKKAATTKAEGKIVYRCTICGEERMELLPVIKQEVQKEKEPNIVNDDLKEKECTKHTYVLIEKKAATELEDGYAIYQCANCKDTFTKTLEKAGRQKDMEDKENVENLNKKSNNSSIEEKDENARNVEEHQDKTVDETKLSPTYDQSFDEDENPSIEKTLSKLSSGEKTTLIRTIATFSILFSILQVAIILLIWRVIHKKNKYLEKGIA